MTHQFRPPKSQNNNNNNGGGGNRRRRGGGGGNRQNLPANTEVDLDSLPEKDYNFFDQMTPAALLKEAKAAKLDAKTLTRVEVMERLLPIVNREMEAVYGKGILELHNEGYGFLRRDNYHPSPQDIYVSQSFVKKGGLRAGDVVFGQVRPPREGDKYPALIRVESVNTHATQSKEHLNRRNFDDLTPLFPNDRLIMETVPDNIPGRMIDLIAPIGKGSRGLIVSPPKAGKTTVLKTIANAITANHPEVVLLVLLVDERPEEVTDMKRSVRGQVISSTFDEPADNHMRVADLCLEQAKRLVEAGRDVVVLLDSLTRLSRASNLTINPSGRTMTGGLDPAALYRPRRFFGAARNIEEGGSMTVIASVLVDTGSKMDENIFEELKGTGNMEIVLDRDLAERRIWPAVDVKRSSTRHEELLFKKEELEGVIQLHRLLANQKESVEATDSLIKLLKRTPTNTAFLESVIARTKATV
jgi:transcription termination factor Rho